MSSIAQEKTLCPEDSRIQQEEVPSLSLTDEDFYEILAQEVREMARLTLQRAIEAEFQAFIGCLPYQRTSGRRDYRNGYWSRGFETRWGPIEALRIPRARGGGFFPSILRRWKRRERKIARVLAEIFLRGVSTRKLRALSKQLWGRAYSAATASRFNQRLKEAFLAAFNRPLEEPIRYLFLDAVALRLRRQWISREALLCAIGITKQGRKVFLGIWLGGRESLESWEAFLLHLRGRGIRAPALVVSDGNPGLLGAVQRVFPGVTLQRCLVHKLRNIGAACPKSIRASVVSEAKRIFYATSQQEAQARFEAWRARWQEQAPRAVACLERDLQACLAFYGFPHRHWNRIRTTNLIERAFREFRRRLYSMDSFPNEESCVRIMFALAQHLNEDWKYKPIKGF